MGPGTYIQIQNLHCSAFLVSLTLPTVTFTATTAISATALAGVVIALMNLETILWKRVLTVDEVYMQLSHSKVIAPHSTVHRPKHKTGSKTATRTSTSTSKIFKQLQSEWAGQKKDSGDQHNSSLQMTHVALHSKNPFYFSDPVSSSCCATLMLLTLSRASSRTWIGSNLLDLVSQHRTVPSMDPG